MLPLAERAYFLVSLYLGQLLRSARYSNARIIRQGSALAVHKRRSVYAPFLISLGDPLIRILDAGIRVLPQREWLERERQMYLTLHDAAIHVHNDGTLVLPCLPGETLAALLEHPRLDETVRKQAIELAVAALAEFHRLGFTHGDAMAENVLVDLDAGVAHWLDFETIHDSRRPMAWRRADDVRALLATTLIRTPADLLAGTLQLILDVYANEEVTRQLAANFSSTWRRPLAFHLAQAGLSFNRFQDVARLLKLRRGQ